MPLLHNILYKLRKLTWKPKVKLGRDDGLFESAYKGAIRDEYINSIQPDKSITKDEVDKFNKTFYEKGKVNK